jgi:prepilin-type N-terminal cleavage/methylation domain-containing protein
MRTPRGFSIIEVLVGLSIFATVFFVVMDAWPVSARAVQQGKNLLIATHLAEQEMEVALTAGYDNVAARSGSQTTSSIIGGNAQTIDMTYEVIASPAGTDMKAVQVIVRWTEGSHNRNVRLETLLSRP